MGSAYVGRKEYDLAKKEYRAAIALAPEDSGLHYRLGMACQTEKSWDEAFGAFEKAVEVAGSKFDRMGALYQIGRTGVFSSRELPRAKAALELYISLEPDSERLPSAAAAYWRLGMIHERMDRKDLARQAYEKALELDPEWDRAREALRELGP